MTEIQIIIYLKKFSFAISWVKELTILQNLCFEEKFLNVGRKIYFLLTGITIYIRNYIRTYKIDALVNNPLFSQFFYLEERRKKETLLG